MPSICEYGSGPRFFRSEMGRSPRQGPSPEALARFQLLEHAQHLVEETGSALKALRRMERAGCLAESAAYLESVSTEAERALRDMLGQIRTAVEPADEDQTDSGDFFTCSRCDVSFGITGPGSGSDDDIAAEEYYSSEVRFHQSGECTPPVIRLA